MTYNPDDYKKLESENFEDYMVRLYTAQEKKELTHKDIANLLNKVTGIIKDESTYRRFYDGFSAGRKYERSLLYGDISERVLCISDLHVPYHLSLDRYKKYAGCVDVLILCGDLVDMQAISKFPKIYRSSPMNEIIQGRQVLIDLIEIIKPKKVIAVYGNHEIRFQSYLVKNIDCDLKELLPQTPLDLIFDDGISRYDNSTKTKTVYAPLSELFENIEIIYAKNWWVKYGETIFCHPLTFSSGIMKTSENAVMFFRNEGLQFTSLVMAHTHHIGHYIIGNTNVFECGCCCDTKQMNYGDGKLYNSQKEGCLYISHDKNGKVSSHHQEVWN